MEWTVVNDDVEVTVATRELAFELADEMALEEGEDAEIAVIDPTGAHIANVTQFGTDWIK